MSGWNEMVLGAGWLVPSGWDAPPRWRRSQSGVRAQALTGIGGSPLFADGGAGSRRHNFKLRFLWLSLPLRRIRWRLAGMKFPSKNKGNCRFLYGGNLEHRVFMPCGAVARAKEIGVNFIWELQGDFHLARCEYRRIPLYFEGSCIFMQQKKWGTSN